MRRCAIPPISWAPDGHAIHYAVTNNGIGNIWTQPLPDGTPRRLTDLDAGEVFSFAWTRDSKRLAVARGTVSTDVVLVTDQAKP
jgi:Tol biopolymer transport system component